MGIVFGTSYLQMVVSTNWVSILWGVLYTPYYIPSTIYPIAYTMYHIMASNEKYHIWVLGFGHILYHLPYIITCNRTPIVNSI